MRNCFRSDLSRVKSKFGIEEKKYNRLLDYIYLKSRVNFCYGKTRKINDSVNILKSRQFEITVPKLIIKLKSKTMEIDKIKYVPTKAFVQTYLNKMDTKLNDFVKMTNE